MSAPDDNERKLIEVALTPPREPRTHFGGMPSGPNLQNIPSRHSVDTLVVARLLGLVPMDYKQ